MHYLSRHFLRRFLTRCMKFSNPAHAFMLAVVFHLDPFSFIVKGHPSFSPGFEGPFFTTQMGTYFRFSRCGIVHVFFIKVFKFKV